MNHNSKQKPTGGMWYLTHLPVVFTNVFSFSPLQSLQEKEKKEKKHVQTDNMSNTGRRKCKYFGAASFSFHVFSVHFLFFFFLFFETQETL